MKEKTRNLFFDVSALSETPGIRGRANIAWLAAQLSAAIPGEQIEVTDVHINESGTYRRGFQRSKGLPGYVSVTLRHCTGQHSETITIWSPLCWNDRFMGTGGGGVITGGLFHITNPDNTSRGQTLPKAILNGFSAATTDAGNSGNDWALDSQTRQLDWERVENWRARSTHFMTVVGKLTAELLHGRPVRYAYFHGGSGGGRQAMVEVQEYPDDYNGVWASCPAINWSRFLVGGFWPGAVMRHHGHRLSRRKLAHFTRRAQDSVGGPEAYYRRMERVAFDPFSIIGEQTKDGPITEADAAVMRDIWAGPQRPDGSFLWYGHRPGVKNWFRVLPIAAIYYPLFQKKQKAFPLCTSYCRWVTCDPTRDFENMTLQEFETLFDRSVDVFADAMADKADLRPFADAGHKLLIDHGIDDPLIPVDGTLDYFSALRQNMGCEAVDAFCRVFITPGDGHGNCSWHGPGITECDGMRALIDWVERGTAPEELRTVQVDRRGNTLRESTQKRACDD